MSIPDRRLTLVEILRCFAAGELSEVEAEELLKSLMLDNDVLRAFENPGSNPGYHYAQVERLKQEWPTLYIALANYRHSIKAL
jgi:hypothetical protein